MRRCITLCMAALLFTTVLSGTAPAQGLRKSGVYLGLKLGPAFMAADDLEIDAAGRDYTLAGSDDSGSVFGLGLLGGYDLYPRHALPMRFELEYMPRSEFDYSSRIGSTSIDADISVSTLFLNAYYDFHVGGLFTPYVGLGLGNAYHTTDARVSGWYGNYGGEDESSDLAWNIGAGVGLRASSRLVLDLGLRYVDYGTAKYKDRGNSVRAELAGSEMLVGLRYEF